MSWKSQNEVIPINSCQALAWNTKYLLQNKVLQQTNVTISEANNAEAKHYNNAGTVWNFVPLLNQQIKNSN